MAKYLVINNIIYIVINLLLFAFESFHPYLSFNKNNSHSEYSIALINFTRDILNSTKLK